MSSDCLLVVYRRTCTHSPRPAPWLCRAAWREAACTLAFIVGPTVGGMLFTGSSLSACISVTGWASVAAAVLVVLVMREDRVAMKAARAAGKSLEAEKAAARAAQRAEPKDDTGLGRSGAATAAAEAAGPSHRSLFSLTCAPSRDNLSWVSDKTAEAKLRAGKLRAAKASEVGDGTAQGKLRDAKGR